MQISFGIMFRGYTQKGKQSKNTSKLCIALARGSSYFADLLLKVGRFALLVSTFGEIIGYTLYMNYGIFITMFLFI